MPSNLRDLKFKPYPTLLAILAALFLSGFGSLPAKDAPGYSSSNTQRYDTVSFRRELGRLKSELQTARKSSVGIRAFRDSLPDTWTVIDHDFKYNVPTLPLTSRLMRAEKTPAVRELQLDQAGDFLDALAAEISSDSASKDPDLASAQAVLSRILARPEFTNRIQQSWWDLLRERINEIIYDALRRLVGGIGNQKSMGEVLLWIGVCVAAVLIAWWIFRRWLLVARMEEMALASTKLPVRSWQEWIFSGRGAAAEGNYRVAIHCAYWAGIARLEELGALPADRAKTPRESLRALTKSELLVPETHGVRYRALSQLTTQLEKIWYGYHVATEGDFRDSLVQLETLGCHRP